MARARVIAVPGYKRGVTPDTPAALPQHVRAELEKLQRYQPNTRTVTITEAYTVSPLDRTLLVDSSAGAVTITLFKATQLITLPLSIIKTSSDAHPIVIAAAAGDAIGTSSTLTFSDPQVAFSMHPDGVDHWYVDGSANVLLPVPWTDLTGVPANISQLQLLVGAADTVPYFTGLGAMALASLTVYGRTIIACASALAARTALGLGTLATASVVLETDLSLSDVTTANVTSTKHGLAPKSPADATQFLNGGATPGFAQVKGADLLMADVTTNDVSITKHGFAPKAPNDTAKFLRGDGTWATTAAASFPAALPTFPTLSATAVLQLSAEAARCTFTKGKDGFVTQMNDATGLWGSNFPFFGQAPRWMKRVIAGRPGIQFDSNATTTTKLIAAATRTLAQPFTVVLAFQDYTAATSDGNFYRDSNNGPCLFISGGNTWAIFGGSVLSNQTLFNNNRTALPPGRTGAAAVSIQVYNGASSLISNNGLEITGAAGATGITGSMHIGANAANASTAKITLYEMLIFNSALSPADRALLNTYYSTALEIDL